MPYIKQKDRDRLDKYISKLYPNIYSSGELNYVITMLLKQLYGRNYSELNRAMGVLECVKQEFYRRDLVPYEEEKIKENGDIWNSELRLLEILFTRQFGKLSILFG